MLQKSKKYYESDSFKKEVSEMVKKCRDCGKVIRTQKEQLKFWASPRFCSHTCQNDFYKYNREDISLKRNKREV
jgi:hypothetical protein